jgi:hypothetical protein
LRGYGLGNLTVSFLNPASEIFLFINLVQKINPSLETPPVFVYLSPAILLWLVDRGSLVLNSRS